MIGLCLLAAHMAGDYLLQTHWMAMNKMKDMRVLMLHCAIYTACFIPIGFLFDWKINFQATFYGLVYSTHVITDCRRWASGDQWPPKPILVDQAVHIVTLAVLGVIFFGAK
jgi:hypothetical protein